jgi:hypothetical protein
MLEGYIVGALTSLVSVVVGFVLGKPYLDRWQSRKHQKQQQPKPGGMIP